MERETKAHNFVKGVGGGEQKKASMFQDVLPVSKDQEILGSIPGLVEG